MSAHARAFYAQLELALINCAVPQHDALVDSLLQVRARDGRVFCLGVGGGAANAAHAVNDFRKLCGIEAYAPTDGIAELTARANDEGMDTIFSGWLKGSHICGLDALMVFSVGGGSENVSRCISAAVDTAKGAGATILGVVGRSDGAVATRGDVVVIMGVGASPLLLTPITEAAQIAVLHALVSDQRLQLNPTKW